MNTYPSTNNISTNFDKKVNTNNIPTNITTISLKKSLNNIPAITNIFPFDNSIDYDIFNNFNIKDFVRICTENVKYHDFGNNSPIDIYRKNPDLITSKDVIYILII